MSVYRTPATLPDTRPLGPRWGATWWRKLLVSLMTDEERAIQRLKRSSARDAKRFAKVIEVERTKMKATLGEIGIYYDPEESP